jgi:RimJ/RimL family protein N-acetyltransferase
MVGPPTTVTRILIKKLFYQKQDISFIGYLDIRQYDEVKKILNDKAYIINRTSFNTGFKPFLTLLRNKYENVIVFGNRNLVNLFFIFFYKLYRSKIFYFPYDYENKFLCKLCEKLSDKIILKGVNFKHLVERNDLVNKESKLDYDNINLVFIGGVWDGNWGMLKRLAKYENITVHIYCTNRFFDDLNNIPDNIKLHKTIDNHKKFIKEISEYDFGLIVIDSNICNYAGHSTTMKMFDYLSANLPILISYEYTDMSRLINYYHLGIIIYDLNNLNDIIRSCDYPSLLESVNVNRKNFLNKVNVFGERDMWIRPIVEDDLELMLAWRNNPKIYKYLNSKNNKLSWEHHYNWYKNLKNAEYYMIIFDNRRIGIVNVINLDKEYPELGVIIGETSLWGKGKGSEAVKLLIDDLHRRGYRKLCATTNKKNKGSNKIWNKFGKRVKNVKNDTEWLYEIKEGER